MKLSCLFLLVATSLAAAEPAPLTQRWAFSILASAAPGDLLSSPAVGADGTVYFGVEVGVAGLGGTSGVVFAVAPDGTEKWRYNTPDWVDSAPAVTQDGGIVVGCWDGSVYRLSKDGALVWSYKTGGYVASSPAIGPDGAIYVGSGDGSLYCLNSDGALRWEAPTADWVDSSPAIAPDGTVYFGGWDDLLHAVGPDGIEKWRYKTLGDIVSSPAIGVDGTVYFTSRDRGVYALTSAGLLKWRFDAGTIIEASPVLAVDGTLYVGTLGGRVYALHPDGTEAWRYPAATLPPLQSFYSTGAVRADGSLLVGSSDNALHCLRPDGTLAFSMPLGDWADSSPVVTPSGSVYIGCSDKKLYAFDGTSPELATEWAQWHRTSRRDGRQLLGSADGLSGRLVNLSTRAVASGGDGTLITGFYVSGSGNRQLLVRGIGPTLGVFGVQSVLADPALTSFEGSTPVATNDNWSDSDPSGIASLFSQVGAFGLSVGSLDAALALNASAGTHSVHVRSPAGGSGAALMELYDAGGDEGARLSNLSTRCHVGVDGNILITGFVIRGGARSVVIRAAGPVLSAFGVSGLLENPQLELFEGQTKLASNDDWGQVSASSYVSAKMASVGAFAFPAGGKDASLVVTLPPGNYTAQVSGVGRTEGVALVEVYELP